MVYVREEVDGVEGGWREGLVVTSYMGMYKHVVWSGEMRGSHWIFPARVYRTRLDRYECWHVICAQSEPVFTSI